MPPDDLEAERRNVTGLYAGRATGRSPCEIPQLAVGVFSFLDLNDARG